MQKYRTLSYWIPKIPLLSLIGIFLLPLLLIEIHYETGLFFIALYISYWTVKVFESYFYVLKSYSKLLKIEKKDYTNSPIIRQNAKHLKHVVIIPIYTEPYDVIEENVVALLANDYTFRENITILLATEARVPDAIENAEKIIAVYGNKGMQIVNIVHPENLPGE